MKYGNLIILKFNSFAISFPHTSILVAG
jgi:hypothetical protein